MQKWEYMIVGCEIESASSRFKARYANGWEIANWEHTELPDYMNQLGRDGWELVATNATVFSANTHALRYVFKRPTS